MDGKRERFVGSHLHVRELFGSLDVLCHAALKNYYDKELAKETRGQNKYFQAAQNCAVVLVVL